MNPHYTYFIILAASVAGPLLLSFDKKVTFYKKWKYLIPALIIPAVLYIIWDIIFTHLNIWHFNEKYISGLKIINLPIEEVLFFFVVPYCCVFVYECIRCYFPKMNDSNNWKIFLKTMAVILIITSLFFYNKSYSFFFFFILWNRPLAGNIFKPLETIPAY
ncbi:MAG: lycopene cyclase domain-containing protein [Chitinophagaceae bacterium]|nr:MAG: lycopene cyclase domain-containing protein [Chitinophagaceae bacterium]